MNSNAQQRRRRRRRRKHIRVTPLSILLFFIILVMASVWITTSAFKYNNPESTQMGVSSMSNVMSSGGNESEVRYTMKFSDKLISEAKDIYENNETLLLLVNKDNPVPYGYEPNLVLLSNGKEKVSEIMHDDLKNMFEEAEQSGYSYILRSGFRSYNYQKSLVEANIQNYISQGMTEKDATDKTLEEFMPAGYSEHQTGLALDITSENNTNLDVTQEKEPDIQWLHNNSWRYGFILRYPDDKVDITKINYEPWHFRYVGKEAAEFMYENGMTLEEFYICVQE